MLELVEIKVLPNKNITYSTADISLKVPKAEICQHVEEPVVITFCGVIQMNATIF